MKARWQVYVGLSVLTMLLGMMLAPNAYTAGGGAPSVGGSGVAGTDFNAYERDQLTAHDETQKPKGWVGPCKKCEQRGAEETAPSSAPVVENVPGGGTTESPVTAPSSTPGGAVTDEYTKPEASTAPEVIRVAAQPPDGADGPVPAGKSARRPGARMPASEEYALNVPPLEDDQELVVPQRKVRPNGFSNHPRPRNEELGLDGFAGRFTVYTDREERPIPLFVKYGFPTVIEFKNGERPSGGAFCGLCGPEGAFNVEAMSDRVGIMPREPSRVSEGLVLATGLTIITDKDRSIVFDVVEITGLTDPAGRSYQRTARCEVRRHPTDTSVVDWSFEKRVADAADSMKSQYEATLSEAREQIVAEKAGERLETLGDFEVDRDADGMEIELYSIVTLGDQTVVKFRVPKGVYADPVAVVERKGRKNSKAVRALARRYTQSYPETVDGKEYLVITIGIDAVHLEEDERLAISLFDKQRNEELRASAGRA